MLLTINHPFMHPVDLIHFLETFVADLGSTCPLLAILVSFQSGKKWGIIQTTSTHLVRHTNDFNFNSYYSLYISINAYHAYLITYTVYSSLPYKAVCTGVIRE